MVNPNRFYTYAYLREDRTPYYIGKGSYRRAYKRNGKPCGVPKDKSRIIFLKQNLTEEEAFRHEKYMIAVFGRKDLGTGILHNRTDGGDGVSGLIVSDEIKRKLSICNTGKKLSRKTREKMSQSQKNMSKETRLKMGLSRKGKTHTEKTKKKISESKKGKSAHNKGIPLTEDQKKKLSEAHKGKKLTEEHKKKLSEIQSKKRWWTDGCGNSVFAVECPYDNWYNGRGTIKNTKL